MRRDLVETESVSGTLGFSDARKTFGARTGTLTWAPKLGATVRSGHRLYQVDGASVFLLDGATPAYRAMGSGTAGTDVLQVERSMRHLGYDDGHDITVDGTWDAGTTAAVQRWQDDTGQDETGRLELGAVVFAPGPRRVAELAVSVGQSTGSGSAGAGQGSTGGSSAEVMTTTSTRRIVTVDLATTKQRLAEEGAAVRVTMPDGRVVGGHVVKVADVARVAAGASEDSDEDPTVKVSIRLDANARTRVDQAPVKVALEKERAKDVLAVPVTALLAQEGGGHAVEVREGTTRRVVEVETGLFTDSMVEIEGDGLRAGMRVSNSAV